MKYILIILLSFALSPVIAQNAEYYFHSGAQTYIGGNNNGAKLILKEGLSKYPNHPKLNELNDKIKEEDQDKKGEDEEDKEGDKKDGEEDKEGEKKEGEDEEKKEGEEKESEEGEEKKEEEGKEGEKSEEEKKKEQEKKEKEGEEQDENKEGEKDSEKQPPSTSDKLKEMNISEEKAKMILEALKNNEIQYIQQNRRKATKRKNNDKPDW